MERAFEHRGMVLRITGRELERSRPGDPRRPSSVRAPGAGRVEIERLTLAHADRGIELSGRVNGRLVAYIYAEMLLEDAAAGFLFGPVVREHVRAARHREVRGVMRPEWDDPVDLTVTLSSSLHVVTDGSDSAFCFSTPEGYESSHRRLEGLYTPAGSKASLRAVLTYDVSGEVRGVAAYRPRGRVSMPRALSLKEGDCFIPMVQILEPSSDGAGWAVADAFSTRLTIRERPLRVLREPLLPGDYVAGLVVQDLDGGLTRVYVSIDGET